MTNRMIFLAFLFVLMMPLRFSLAQSNDLDSLVEEAQNYFDDVQTAEEQYRPFISPDDPPAIDKNLDIMAKFKPMLEELYYDPDRFETYLDQLGIDYPQLTPTEIRRN